MLFQALRARSAPLARDQGRKVATGGGGAGIWETRWDTTAGGSLSGRLWKRMVPNWLGLRIIEVTPPHR